MWKRSLKVIVALVLSLMFTVSLVKIVLLIWTSYPAWLQRYTDAERPLPTVEEWLDSEQLSAYKKLFRDKASTFVLESQNEDLQCGSAMKILLRHLDSHDSNQNADILSKLAQLDEKLEAQGQKLQHLEIELSSRRTSMEETTRNRNNFRKIGTKYYHIEDSQKMTWYRALDKCHKMGGHLANVQSAEELQALSRMLKGQQYYWIDLTDEETYGVFVSSTTGMNGTFFNWDTSMNRYLTTTSSCVALQTNFGEPMDNTDKMQCLGCRSEMYFICEASSDDNVN
ncbi:GL19670 [Drosophila persimilis]|uniref:GL19670 n=1 Tax=Drosophila persimilis TaxID=7234 RepID=B4G809_DROPE|nr:GL19670 [Drosophila persimilis]